MLGLDQVDILLVSFEIVRCCEALGVCAVLDTTFERSAMCRRVFSTNISPLQQIAGVQGILLLLSLVLECFAALEA